MSELQFHDQPTLSEAAEKLGKQAVSLGLIPSFVVHYFPDNWEFYIPDKTQEAFTPEEAYLHFKKLIKAAG